MKRAVKRREISARARSNGGEAPWYYGKTPGNPHERLAESPFFKPALSARSALWRQNMKKNFRDKRLCASQGEYVIIDN